MKHISFSLPLIVCLLTTMSAHAQQVSHDTWQSLQVVFSPQELSFGETTIDGQQFSTLTLDGYMPSAAVGAPSLPTFSRLIEVPLCKGFEVRVSDAVYDTIRLRGARLMPSQPSRSKSDTTPTRLVIDSKIYATDAFYGQQEAFVEVVGIARDRRLARLQFSPVRYNPVRSMLIVCRHAVVTVRYIEADKDASAALFERHHSPAFSIMGGVLNNLYPKSVSSTAPIRYLIVAHSSFRGQMDDFVQWKRRKGYLTDIVYTDSAAVGSTTTSIASYIQSQYTNATLANPAPTFLLLVGDHEQIPAFTGVSSTDHITDLYYISWTSGDNIPDCYCGRFSAQNVSQLTPQIEKTLMYEQYTFNDPSFLDRAVLVAGVDGGTSGDYGYTHADPAMDYAAIHYINSTQGFTQVNYFKNNTSIVPSAPGVTIGSCASSNSAIVRGYYNQGAGLINYSAHGSATSWGTPNFTTTHIAAMTNVQKFGLMIGNCCLTNKFETTTCFGEALLRKNNYCGAVGYIGGSNSTYWYEDFYWSVGLRSGISATMSMAYNATNLGAYDRLCHTHGEAYSQWALTQGAVMMVGNMAVESSTSSRKLYYWEIYHLMGDPSVMPYLTQASVMPLAAPSILASDITSLIVTAAPYAYVALTDTLSHTLISSAYADNAGVATLPLPATLPVGGYEIAASAQQYRTAFSPLSIIAPSGAYPMVAGARELMPLNAGDTVPVALTLVNFGSSTAYNVTVTTSSSDSNALSLVPVAMTIDSLTAGDTVILLRQSVAGSAVPDGTPVLLTTLTHWNGGSVPNTSSYSLTINAPDIRFDISVDGGSILPGHGAPLTALLTNNGHAALLSDRLRLASPTRLLAVGSGTIGTSSPLTLLPGDTASVLFSLYADSLLPTGIEVPLSFTFESLPTSSLVCPLYVGECPLETFEGGSFHSTAWTQGTYPWTFTNAEAYAGSYCLRSTAALTHNQTAQVSIPVTLLTPDSLTFFYKVSSEANYDKFHFYLDNTDLLSESGELAWTRAAFLIPAGSHTLKFTYEKDYSVNGNSDCAWIDNVTLPHQSSPARFLTDELCVGSQYIIAGDTINTDQPGTGSYIGGAAGSDSVLLTDYVIHPTYNTIDSLTACDSLIWHGSTYTASTLSPQFSTLSTFGCDSIVTLHLTIHHSHAGEETIVACDSLYWMEFLFTSSADTTEHLTTVAGCDSTICHHLRVNYSAFETIADTTYADSYVWNDSVYTTSGIFTQVFSTEQGCDSIVMLMLTIIHGGTQGVESPLAAQSVKVYPNPTGGQLTIEAEDILEVEVTDNAGRRVASFTGTNRPDLSRLPTGNYLLHIRLQSGYATCRIVKQ